MHIGNSAEDGKRYLESFSSTLTPPRLTMCAVGGPCSAVWEAHSVADYGLAPERFLEFKAEDGTTLYGRLLLPPNVPNDGKIPLIVNVYGGPAAQLVLKGWGGSSALFDQILAREGFAIFAVDNRGTPRPHPQCHAPPHHHTSAVQPH